MKRKMLTCVAVLGTIVLPTACETLFVGSRGEMVINFAERSYESTKAAYSLPDTNDFVLEVTDASGKLVYGGKFGAAPEKMELPAGNYGVKVYSNEFKAPAFDLPQYGDYQLVKLNSGSYVKVNLLCSQLNAGIRLKTDSSFLTAYPGGLLYVKSPDGKLLYAYRETRIAYFNPGQVSVVLYNNGTEETLLSRTLASQQVLTVNISAVAPSGSASERGINIEIDTSRVWTSENYVIGADKDKGAEPSNAYSVVSAKENIGDEDVWVYGYIVGGDLTSSSSGISFETPFSSRTHLAIAAKSSVTSKSSCMSVFLPDGEIRDELNLCDHPENLGRQVFIRGDIVSAYFGIPGVKNLSEYKWQ